MSPVVERFSGTDVLVYPAGGPILLGAESDANDLIGDTWGHETQYVAVPVERIGADFFRLRTRLAGEIVQKFVNYRIALIVVGDITDHVESSDAFARFVDECNRGRQTWFVPDTHALAQRFASR